MNLMLLDAERLEILEKVVKVDRINVVLGEFARWESAKELQAYRRGPKSKTSRTKVFLI